MLPLLQSLRPHQWTKNLVVFAAVFFSGRGVVTDDLLTEFAAFGLFCALSSAVYLMNDVFDVERDRMHPVKRNRPIASGAVSIPIAIGTSTVLGVIALGGGWLVGERLLSVYAAYLVLQIGYSYRLKHVVIVDVLCIAAGFLLRVFAGIMAINAVISPWIIACSVQLALFLALCKRRAEAAGLPVEADKANTQRPALVDYAGPATDMMVAVMATATLVTYTMYTVIPHALISYWPKLGKESEVRFGAEGMVWTLPFVLYGILRYLFLVYQREKGERPEEVLLTDRPLIGAILLYALVAGWAVYSGP